MTWTARPTPSSSRLTDEDGRYGIGETDAPPHVVKAFLEMPTAHLWSRNVSEILIGADPLEVDRPLAEAL